jgi:hypothetical protein
MRAAPARRRPFLNFRLQRAESEIRSSDFPERRPAILKSGGRLAARLDFRSRAIPSQMSSGHPLCIVVHR